MGAGPRLWDHRHAGRIIALATTVFGYIAVLDLVFSARSWWGHDLPRIALAYQVPFGIAQAASLHVSAALSNFAMHEYQHSIFDRNQQFVRSAMRCAEGYFYLPNGPGLGTEPTDTVFDYVMTEASSSAMA